MMSPKKEKCGPHHSLLQILKILEKEIDKMEEIAVSALNTAAESLSFLQDCRLENRALSLYSKALERQIKILQSPKKRGRPETPPKSVYELLFGHKQKGRTGRPTKHSDPENFMREWEKIRSDFANKSGKLPSKITDISVIKDLVEKDPSLTSGQKKRDAIHKLQSCVKQCRDKTGFRIRHRSV